jgi:hypothetical protein
MQTRICMGGGVDVEAWPGISFLTVSRRLTNHIHMNSTQHFILHISTYHATTWYFYLWTSVGAFGSLCHRNEPQQSEVYGMWI